MQVHTKSVLSFYCSSEAAKASGRSGLVITAGRCSTTTTTSCVACIGSDSAK